MFLRARDAESVWISSVRPSVELDWVEDQNSKAVARGEWNILRYSDEALNAFEHYYQGSYRYSRERWSLVASGGYRVQTTLTSELGEAGVLAQLNRKQWVAEPSLSYQLTPKVRVGVDYALQDVTYQEKQGVFVYTPYRYQQLSGSWQYTLRERAEWFLAAFVSRYAVKSFPQDTDTLGLQLGGRYGVSETLTLGVSAGPRYSKAQTQVPVFLGLGFDPQTRRIFPRFRQEKLKDTTLGFVFDFTVQKKLERGAASFRVGQQLVPLGVGGLSQQFSTSLSWSYTLSERWQANLEIVASRNRALGEDSNRLIDRDYIRIMPELRWRCSEEISLGLAYGFYYQKFKQNKDPGVGNEVIVNLVYQPLKEL